MLKIISIISIIIVSAILLLQIDDELNPEIEHFLAQAEATGTSEAYLYLMGIDAATDKNPSEVGKQFFESIKKNEPLTIRNVETTDILDTTNKNKLPLPTGELFCSGWETDCFDTIFSTNADLSEILLSNATLLERYQTFIKMTDYQTLTRPTILAIVPHYQYLVTGNRLVILKTINTARTSDPVQDINMLLDNLSALRQHLKSADNLIGKMIYIALISHNLDALSLLIHQQKIAFEHQIAPVSSAERNLGIVMARELAMAYDLGINLDGNPDFFALMGEDNQMTTPVWLVRAVFKPNISINAIYPLYKNVVEKSQLEPKEFALTMDNTEVYSPQSAYVRNIAGTILMNISVPNFEQYIARLFDLNAKIAIFNQTTRKTKLPDNLNYIKNPYYETAGTASYSKDGKSICLTGPLDDDRSQRCLRMKI